MNSSRRFRFLPILAMAFARPLAGADSSAFENPSKVRTIHAVLLSHLDIGFTATPDAVASSQKASLDAAARLVRENRDLVWTIESAWQLEEWLKRAEDPSEVEGMMSLIRSGRIALGALPVNFHTAALSEEVLSRAALPAARLRRRFGVPAEVALQDDVPGFSWALPRALAGAGIRHLLLGVNTTFGGGGGIQPGSNAFRWESPDGSRVLVWVATGSYVEAERWGFGLWSREDESEKLMRERLEELARAGYPGEDYLVMAGLGDNIPAGAARAVLDRIRRWNDRHASPKIRTCHPAEFFRLLEETRGAGIPVLRGDWSGWWEPVKASSPLATAEFRWASAHLGAAEALAVFAGLHRQPSYPRYDFAWIERGLIEYGEHTGEASCGWPGLTTRGEILRENQIHMEQACGTSARVRDALERGLDRLAERLSIGKPAILVFNPACHARGGTVKVPVEEGLRPRIGSEELELRCPQVPPLGYRLLEVEEARAAGAGAARREEGDLLKRWTVEGGRGFGEAYLSRDNPMLFGSKRDAGKRLAGPGPLRSRRIASSGEGEVEAALVLDGDALNGMEEGAESGAVLIDFELALDPRGARFLAQGPGLWFEPERDRLNGASPSPSACAWAFAVEAKEGTVLFSPVEAPIAQFLRGEKSVLIRSVAWMRGRRGKPRSGGDAPFDRVEPAESALRRFTYRIRFAGGAFDPVAATRFATESLAPLAARFVVPFFPPPGAPLAKGPSVGGGIEISPDSVVLEALKAAEPLPGEGAGGAVGKDKGALEVTARLREAAGHPANLRLKLPAKILSARRASLDEEPLPGEPARVEGDTLEFEIGAHEIATFRIQMEIGGTP